MKLSEKAQVAFDTVVRKFETGDLTEMVQSLAILPEPHASSGAETNSECPRLRPVT